MKKLKIFSILLVVICLALGIYYFTFNVEPNKVYNDVYKVVRVIYCKPKENNITGKDTYLYFSRFGKLEKNLEQVVEKFNSLEEYNKSKEFKMNLEGQLVDVSFTYDEDNLTITTEQVSYYKNNNYSVSDMMRQYVKYNCSYVEYY